MRIKSIQIFLYLFISLSAICNTQIGHLQVEYTTNPIGIDVAKPRFSWQMMSDQRGTNQTAYQLLIAGSEADLQSGKYLYDTGKIASSESVSIPYEGKALQPSTRYFWKVKVWDTNNACISPVGTAFFETALLGSSWNNAQWIGSSIPQLSRYRSHYVLDYDLSIPQGSQKGTFVFGVRDKENYVTVEMDISNKTNPLLRVLHTTDGKTVNDLEESLSSILPPASLNEKHRISIDVRTVQYAMQYILAIAVDGKPVKEKLMVIPYPNGDLVCLCRLYGIGFNQAVGQQAVFSDVTIRENVWNTTLYKSPKVFAEKGNGQMNIWEPGEETAAPMLRKEINLSKEVRKASFYATARGIYELSINGKKVSNDYYNPGWTDYRFRIMYNTFDVTSMLRKGTNAIGAILGTGWWSEHGGFSTDWQDQYGTQESLLGKLLVEYTDGTEEIFVTDPSWKCYDNGPILSNSLQNGVDYDARREVNGWNEPAFNDASWYNVSVYPRLPAQVKLQAYVGNTIQNHIQLKPLSVNEPKPGIFVYDMGQNMVGIPEIRLKGKPGQEISLRYGEMNYPEIIPTDPVEPYTIELYKERKGQVYTDNYRGALSEDHYTMKGTPEGETFRPDFTSHGFRYLEIHGLKEALPLEDITGIVLESVGEQTSGYETSDKLINKLFENIVWGQRGNFLSIPTDCPQRDERMGWSGDAQVFARTATYNMNVNQFYTRWLYSLRDNQGENGNYPNFVPVIDRPDYGGLLGGGALGWTEVGIILPWQVYQQYNDIQILEQQYSSMVQYMNYLEREAVNYIQPYGKRSFGDLGDWLAIQYTNSLLTNTAYFAYDAQLMSKIAEALGKKKDAAYYRQLYDNIKQSFNQHFVDAEGYTCAPASESLFGPEFHRASGRIDTQTSYILPLYVGLFNEKNHPLAIRRLQDNISKNNNTLTTGFIGTPYLNLVLSENGLDDLAYTLFEQTSYPSWLYPVLQGATTMWERWNSYTIVNGFGPVGMNSFNHYAYGAIQEWMFAYSAGIQRDENHPGYKQIILQPRIGGTFSFINGHYDSVYGRIESGWKKTAGGYQYEATVPANTSATLHLSVSDPNQVKEGGKVIKNADGIQFVSFKDGKATYKLTSGKYTFTVAK